MKKEITVYTFFGRSASLVEHLQTLIETNTVTMPYGQKHVTETGRLLEAVLAELETSDEPNT